MTARRSGARRAALGLAVALALAPATACTAGQPGSSSSAPEDGASGGSSPSAQASVDAGTADAAPEPAATARLASGDVAIDVVVDAETSGARVGADAEGAATLTLAPGPERAVLVLTTPGSFAANADGSVTVLDEAGTPVAGLSGPRAADPGTGQDAPSAEAGDAGDAPDAGDTPGTGYASGSGDGAAGRGARLVVAGPTRVEVTSGTAEGTASGTGAATDPGAVTTTLGTTALRSAVWGEREGGRSIAVDPTSWARAAGAAGLDVLWTALVAAEPEADTPGMHDQLACHALGAPDKATWNLEPWRPDVGLVAVLAARCNPT